MRIVYVGCVESSYVGLKVLIEQKKEVVGVITKESSKFNSDFVDLSYLAKENHIPYIYAPNINDNEIEKVILLY